MSERSSDPPSSREPRPGSGLPPDSRRKAELSLEEKERLIDEAFARRSATSEIGLPSPSSKQTAPPTVKGSSILTRGPDGKVRIERLEKTERRSQRVKPKVAMEPPTVSAAGAQPSEASQPKSPLSFLSRLFVKRARVPSTAKQPPSEKPPIETSAGVQSVKPVEAVPAVAKAGDKGELAKPEPAKTAEAVVTPQPLKVEQAPPEKVSEKKAASSFGMERKPDSVGPIAGAWDAAAIRAAAEAKQVTEGKPKEPTAEPEPVKAVVESQAKVEPASAAAQSKAGTEPGKAASVAGQAEGAVEAKKPSPAQTESPAEKRAAERTVRKKAAVNLREAGLAEGKPARKPFRYGLELGAALAALLVVAAGVLIYLSLRETRVQVAITPGTVQLEPEAWIVYDFSDRIGFVKEDLQRRRQPYLESLKETERNLSAARADLAGREARMRLLREAFEQDREEMPKIVAEQQAALRRLWEEEGPRLDREYEARKNQVNQAIAARAQQLGLRLERDDELDAPEVMVNAFRLALYGAPQTVDTAAERKWAEDQLKAWKDYEDAFGKRQDAIRERAVALRGQGAPRLEEVQERLDARQLEMDALAEEMKEFQDEVERHEKARAALVEEMRGLIGPFVADLEKAPAEYVHARWPIENGWKIDVRRLDKDPNLPPGTYRLMLRGHQDGEPVWAFQEFTVEPFATTQIKFAESDFFPVRSLLETKN